MKLNNAKYIRNPGHEIIFRGGYLLVSWSYHAIFLHGTDWLRRLLTCYIPVKNLGYQLKKKFHDRVGLSVILFLSCLNAYIFKS